MRIVPIAVCLVLLAGPALAQATTAKGTDGKSYLQTPAGMTLYVYDGDRTPGGEPAPSTCTDECAKFWPPFAPAADAAASGDWSIQTRKDGTKQWAYKGRPLYTFTRDKKAGEQQGEAFNGNKWHVAQP